MSAPPPLVSVVTTFLNGARFLAESVESVLGQTYDHWELILVDDGSTDESSEIARRYAACYPDRIAYVQHPGGVNRGISASRNLGIERSAGELVAFLDSDDVWDPAKLEEQVRILEEYPEVGMTYGLALYWSGWRGPEYADRDYVAGGAAYLGQVAPPPALTLASYPLGQGVAPCPSDLMVRREVLERVGGFEASFTGPLQLYEDQAFLAKVYLTTPVYVADRVWLRYRQHPDSCVATVVSGGGYREVRGHFLRWFAGYLREIDYRERPVWQALRRARRRERYSRVRRAASEVSRLCVRPFPRRLLHAVRRLFQFYNPGRLTSAASPPAGERTP